MIVLVRISHSNPTFIDVFCKLSGNDGQGVPIYCHVTLKFHPEEEQHQHTSNFSAKDDKNLCDKSLDDLIPYGIATFDVILAGSFGRSKQMPLKIWSMGGTY